MQNAFYARLGKHGFDPFTLIVPDPLHEFQLGVWRNVFHHIIRILYAHDAERVGVMDKRYRQMPTFGKDTIRRFPEAVSGMTRLAGRDFENLLQV
ncbi:hypothetical protein BKA70DRAFT_1099470, partial [Coprinopsis sp. MPI-PUGE-AT-0042]